MNRIKAIQSKLNDIEMDTTIIGSRLNQDIEFIDDEIKMKAALLKEKENVDSEIQTLQNQKVILEQRMVKNKREYDYLVTYIIEKNREISSVKQSVKDKQIKIEQLRNYINLVSKVNTLNNRHYPLEQKRVKYYNPLPFESLLILRNEDLIYLQNLTQMNFQHKCFSSINYGFDPVKFHMLCDFVGPTLFLVQTNSNEIYGGYTQQSWSGHETKKDETAVIFNFSKKQSSKVYNEQYAIITNPRYFAQFGRDLFVLRENGWSAYPCYYSKNNSDLEVFKNKFDVKLIEVFY